MNAKSALVIGLRNSMQMLDTFTKDLTPQQMLARPCADANCAAWTIGHLVLTDRYFAAKAGVPESDLPPLPEGFERRFSQKENAPQASDFGDTSVLRDLFRQNRERLIAAVEAMDDAKLDEGGSDHPFFKTLGTTLNFVALHTCMHAGQITIIRRSLGMPPLI